KARAMYPVKEEEKTIAGVTVRYFTPPNMPANKRNRLLINLHGGGFQSDASSLLESIPIASMTQTQVVSVYYRLAPKFVFPAPVDDVVAVYKELLKTHQPGTLAIYGTSAGAILTAQVAVRLKHDKVPLPAALGFFTGHVDFTASGDSHAFFGVPGLMGARIPEAESSRPYMAGHDPKDPLASPIFADLTGLPPTLCITGTRDQFLSSTSIFHRALLRAGVDAELVVFEAMSHAHWFMIGIPEATEALETMAKFFDRNLGK
ncbi:MAG: alpha/beta hydrolase fold domain-containing protein, partial [Candidatus Solibacter sp.]|nr:alpha/beta hydrolase fold domain-containing protein [Candidatus Solibacter sp.]